MDGVEHYIYALDRASKNKWNELIVECMNTYNVPSTADLTEQQLREFCKKRGIEVKKERQNNGKDIEKDHRRSGRHYG